VPFEPGDVLVAYTDGLVEQRRHDYDDAVAALHAVIGVLGGLASAAEIADGVLGRVAESEDDQALVVVRHTGVTGVPGAGRRRAARPRKQDG
jgi:serine phosphatase RsbU (regulator of sigma subunit)